MFIKSTSRRYGRGGSQHARGLYLLLACSDEKAGAHRELRGLARMVTLNQCGHWMMGEININGKRIGLSGPLGSDGLPKNQDEVPWDQMVPMPEDIAGIYWKDDTGHNDVGTSGKDLLQWALANEKVLVKAGRSLRID